MPEQSQPQTQTPRDQSEETVNGLPFVKDAQVPPREEELDVTEPAYIDSIHKTDVRSTLQKEVYQPKYIDVEKEVIRKQPTLNVLHRTFEVKLPVTKKQIVKVPQQHIVDTVKEVPEDIIRERIVEKAVKIFQERIVPLPTRNVVEETVEVDADVYEKLASQTLREETVEYFNINHHPIYTEKEVEDYEVTETKHEKLNFHSIRELIKKDTPQNLEPRFKHTPQPVYIPMLYYKANPVERLVHRCVPVPVELDLVQEYRCPTLIPVWEEQPVPVHYTRVIEKPVPADALMNKPLMRMYLNQTKDLDEHAEKRWNGRQNLLLGCFSSQVPKNCKVARKMTPEECSAYGIKDANWEEMKSFNSRGWSEIAGNNVEIERNLLTSTRPMNKVRNAESLVAEDQQRVAGVA